ncbi:MAG: DUF1893 domain-containing protein [Deltaproteobacteria bacterium]|nr:DUF1893 domain-containing protein [Deltaproteobacteria bacterium]
MIQPDFSQYALALIHEGNVVYTSKNQGLVPLVACIEACSSRYRNCRLYDRVIGLAAAKLVVASRMIVSVFAGVSSQPAAEFLKKSNIPMESLLTVPHIIGRDGVSICPMEQRAMATEDADLFLTQMRYFFRSLKDES